MSTTQRWTAFVIGCIFYAYVLLTRNLPLIAADAVCQKFSMSEAVFGQYCGTYFITYALGTLPIAYALDRFGPRWVVSLSIFACVIGLLPMLIADSANLLILGRMLLGLGSATAILSVFKINRAFFQPEQFATLLGIAGTAGYISSFLGFGPLKRLFTYAGYEGTIAAIILTGLVLSVCAACCISSVPSEERTGFLDSIKQLAVNKSFWIIVLIGGLMIWGLEGFSDRWSVPLLSSLFKFNGTQATDITSLIPVGFAIGSIVLPLIIKKIGKDKEIFGFSGLMLACLFLGLFLPGIPTWGVITLYLLLGCFSAYQIICIDLAGKVVAPALSTLSSAATNMLIMSFGYFYHTISSMIMSGRGATDVTCNLLRYTRTDLLIGLSPFIICGLLAFIINRSVKRF